MWLALGLKLLGIGNAIREFIKKNYKWIVPILLAVSLVALGYIKYKSDMASAYDNGYAKAVTEVNDSWYKKVDEEAARNKQFELTLREIIVQFGEKAVREATSRVTKEIKYRDRINTIIKTNPKYEQCVVDQEVIDNRNAIRQLGPTIIKLEPPK